MSVTYSTNMNNAKTNFVLNGATATFDLVGKYNEALNTAASTNDATGVYFGKQDGEAGNGLTLMSMRIYNRVLTSAELAQNAAVDQKRYLATPEFEIGGQTCTDVRVLSATQISVTVPASTLSGDKSGTVPIRMRYAGSGWSTVGS